MLIEPGTLIMIKASSLTLVLTSSRGFERIEKDSYAIVVYAFGDFLKCLLDGKIVECSGSEVVVI